ARGADRADSELCAGDGDWIARRRGFLFHQELLVSEARPSGRATLTNVALAYARASDTIRGLTVFTNNLLSIITWLPAVGAILILGLFKKDQNQIIKKFATRSEEHTSELQSRG